MNSNRETHINSLNTFYKVVQGDLTNREYEVLCAIQDMDRPVSCEMVADYMNNPPVRRVYPNTISGRFKPLRDGGHIVVEKTINRTDYYITRKKYDSKSSEAAKEAVMAVMEKSRLANQPTSSVQQGGFDF